LSNVTFHEGINFAEQIINEHPDVDGIFAITDLVAIGVLSYFNDIGIKITEQVAVIGFSNWFMSQVLTPKLSTVDQPSHQIGIESFNLLLEEMNYHKLNLPFAPRTILLETTVTARESSLKENNN
jgi:LacI family transcriptional regulator